MALSKEKLSTASPAGPNSMKWNTIRQSLLVRHQTLVEELRETTSLLLKEEEAYADAFDQANADADKALTLQMKNRDRDALWAIEEALRRIEAGTFGECERCGDEIAEARMRANPATTLCIDCKAELESGQHRYSVRS